MGIIVDLILIGILALSIFLGYKKGLVALAIKLCAFVIAIVVTLVFYKPVTNLIVNTTNIDETIQNSILEKANEIITTDEDSNYVSEIKESIKNDMLPETAESLSITIISYAVMIILFILTKIALRFVTALANLVAKLPILKQFNKLGGIIYGLLRGLLIIYAGLVIVSIVGQINPENSVHESINESYITKAMYNNNILNVFIK